MITCDESGLVDTAIVSHFLWELVDTKCFEVKISLSGSPMARWPLSYSIAYVKDGPLSNKQSAKVIRAASKYHRDTMALRRNPKWEM